MFLYSCHFTDLSALNALYCGVDQQDIGIKKRNKEECSSWKICESKLYNLYSADFFPISERTPMFLFFTFSLHVVYHKLFLFVFVISFKNLWSHLNISFKASDLIQTSIRIRMKEIPNHSLLPSASSPFCLQILEFEIICWQCQLNVFVLFKFSTIFPCRHLQRLRSSN